MIKKGIKVTAKGDSKKQDRVAYDELLKVASEESIYLRQKAIEAWWRAWIVEIEKDQLLLDKKYIDSEHNDLIKERLMFNCLEESVEEIGTYSTSDKKISLKYRALRRKKHE